MSLQKLPLKELIKLHYGKALKEADRMQSGCWNVFGSSGKVGKHDKTLTEKTTIIIGRKGSVGEVTFAPYGGWTIDTAFFTEIIDPKKLDLRYLYYFLQRSNLKKHTITTSIPGINRDNIYNTEITLPLLSEQKRIAAILDKADTIRRKRRQAIQLADEFFRSVFLDMFGDPGHNQFQWPYKTLPDLAAKEKYAIKRGPFGGSLKKEIFVKEGYLIYEQYHAINDDFSLARYFITEKKYSELEMFKVKPGDLIISCSGVTLGRISEIPRNALPGIINQALLKLSLNKEIVNNTHFKHLFRHKRIQEKLFDVSRGSGIPNFPPMTVINSIKFPMPPIKLQKIFAQIVQKVELMKTKFEFGFKGPVNLNEALAQRAFRGEL